MVRTLSLAVLMAALGMTGCRMCDAPYDYCPPDFTGDMGGCAACGDCGTGACGDGCGAACDPHARRNSVFSGYAGGTYVERPVGEGVEILETSPMPTPASPAPRAMPSAPLPTRPKTSVPMGDENPVGYWRNAGATRRMVR